MSITELNTTARDLMSVRAMIEELQEEAEALTDKLKAAMIDQGSEVLQGDGWKAKKKAKSQSQAKASQESQRAKPKPRAKEPKEIQTIRYPFGCARRILIYLSSKNVSLSFNQ